MLTSFRPQENCGSGPLCRSRAFIFSHAYFSVTIALPGFHHVIKETKVMTLSVQCPACGAMHKAPERAVGKMLPCLVCKTPMAVFKPIDPAAILLQDDDPPPPSPETAPDVEELPPPSPAPKPRSTRPRKKSKAVDLASLPPLTSDDPPFWRRHLHWLLALALIPLVVSLLGSSTENSLQDRRAEIEKQLRESLEHTSPAERNRILERLKNAETVDELTSLFPDQRLPGALLSRSTVGHYLMALLAIVVYMAFFMFLASDGSAKPTHVLLVGLFTATIGVGFLLLVQLLASLTGGRMFVGFSVVAIFFYVLKFIAFSYSAALDPDNGFLVSFLGFTVGVGLCEEFVKAIPLVAHRSAESRKTWRSMLIWGLASGAGFGIAEGIMYSDRYYNGVFGLETYLVRFLSCVALHSIWTGSAAILLYIRRDMFDNIDSWYEWIFPIIFIIGAPALLHGLYDTCLKKEMNGVALLVAFASFGYLAFLFSRLQTVDDDAASKAMLREYERRKAGLAR
jgi:RsiW-degrading membrane proteinase PrsW (M82 family)